RESRRAPRVAHRARSRGRSPLGPRRKGSAPHRLPRARLASEDEPRPVEAAGRTAPARPPGGFGITGGGGGHRAGKDSLGSEASVRDRFRPSILFVRGMGLGAPLFALACAPKAAAQKPDPTGPFAVSDYYAPSGAMGDGATKGNLDIPTPNTGC